MNKKKWVVICIGALIFCTGCSVSSSKKVEDKKESVATKEPIKEQTPFLGEDKLQNDNDTKENDSKKGMTITIYYGNENGDGLISEETTIDELNPTYIWEKLNSKEIGTSEIKINSIVKSTVDDSPALELDFSKEFDNYINSFGTSGEKTIIRSICNTFLEAYESELIHITVNGQQLSTGHADYPGYLRYIEY